MTRKVLIVWNDARTEGVVFLDDPNEPKSWHNRGAEHDAEETRSGKFGNPSSALGGAFRELYDDDEDMLVETLELPDLEG